VTDRRLAYAITDAEAYADVYGTGYVRVIRTEDGYRYQSVDPATVVTRAVPECGGCQGLGSHRRWCRVAVGSRASLLGRAAEQAESLGDTVGANYPQAANALYGASGALREAANDAAMWNIAQHTNRRGARGAES
jgi:hypothetical protein